MLKRAFPVGVYISMRAEAVFLLILTAVPASASDPQVAFSPHGGATELIVKTVLSAKKNRMAAYLFTSEPIAAALIEGTIATLRFA
jgi:hypothetical protein